METIKIEDLEYNDGRIQIRREINHPFIYNNGVIDNTVVLDKLKNTNYTIHELLDATQTFLNEPCKYEHNTLPVHRKYFDLYRE